MTTDKAKEVWREIQHLITRYKDLPANDFIFEEPIDKALKEQAKDFIQIVEDSPIHQHTKQQMIKEIKKKIK